jgi:hypothetical protein
MEELAGDVSDPKTRIWLCSSQVNTTRSRTKIGKLKNETTILKASHELIMLYLFQLHDQETKRGISAPATIQSAS